MQRFTQPAVGKATTEKTGDPGSGAPPHDSRYPQPVDSGSKALQLLFLRLAHSAHGCVRRTYLHRAIAPERAVVGLALVFPLRNASSIVDGLLTGSRASTLAHDNKPSRRRTQHA